MEQYLRSVGNFFVAVGTKDPRYNTMDGINFRLGRQLAAYAHEDPAPSRVRPIPISILHCLGATAQGGTSRQQAVADLAWIAFFFLLRPGEYFQGGNDTVSTPFCLQYIQFYVDGAPFPATTATPYNCATTSFIRLLFTTQKNGAKADSIGHGETGHPRACAVAAVRRHANGYTRLNIR